MSELREATGFAPGAKVHKFEIAGLGQAPYRLVDVVKRVYQACEGAPVLPGSSCDYCGTGIMFEYWLASKDGIAPRPCMAPRIAPFLSQA